MNSNDKIRLSAMRRRDVGLGALALGTAVLLAPRFGAAQNILERSWDAMTGGVKDLAEDVREVAAYSGAAWDRHTTSS